MDWKRIIVAVLGLITTFLVVLGIESLNNLLYPEIFKHKPNNIKDAKIFIENMPVFALIVVLIAHFFGLLFGGFITFLFHQKSHKPLIWMSIVFFIGMAINVILIPHPGWFMILDITAMLLAFALLYTKLNWSIPTNDSEKEN